MSQQATNQDLGDSIPAQLLKLKEPRMAAALMMGCVVTAALYFIHAYGLKPLPAPESIVGFFNLPAIRLKFFASGPIPLAIVVVFMMGLHHLLQIWWKLIAPINVATAIEQDVVGAARGLNDMALIRAVNERIRTGRLGYFSSRFVKLLRRWDVDKDISAVSALKNDMLDSDEEDFSVAFGPTTWVEWALPLLGFLGTVIGVSSAISGVKEGVELIFRGGSLSDSVRGHFTEGFKGLALAFDTTFQGLAGLIVVGFLHFLVRRRLSIHLAQARVLFTDYVAHWKTDGMEPVVVAVGSMKEDIEALSERISAVNQTLLECERRSGAFRDNAAEMVSRVIFQSPKLDWIREILFEPQVQFAEVWAEIAAKLARVVDHACGHASWRLVSVGAQSGRPGVFVVAIENKKKDGHLVLSLDANQPEAKWEMIAINGRVRRLLPAVGEKSQLAVSEEDGKLVKVSLKSPGGFSVLGEFQDDDDVFGSTNSALKGCVVVRKGNPTHLLWVTESGGRVAMLDLGALPGWAPWRLSAYHDASSTLVVAGESDGRWILAVVHLGAPDAEGSEPKMSVDRVQVGSAVKLKQIVMTSERELVLLDDRGGLYHCSTVRPTPILLKNKLWSVNRGTRIWSGTEGWIAAVCGTKLSMWRVFRGGYLQAYDQAKEGLEVSAIDPATLVATPDGRFLVGLRDRLLTIWEFPRYTIDGSS